MKIGIYKIVSPSGRVYVGQSIDIKQRIKKYKNNCKTQVRLKRSFDKYGFKNHTFTIIEECDITSLNKRERYWQDFYDVLNGGLNSRLTKTEDKSGKLSEETKNKISKSRKGIGIGKAPWNIGLKMPESFSIKLSSITSGEGIPMYGRTHSDKTKDLIASKNRGKRFSNETNSKKASRSKLVLDTETGIFYSSATEASLYYNINESTLRGYLSGKRANKTNLLWV